MSTRTTLPRFTTDASVNHKPRGKPVVGKSKAPIKPRRVDDLTWWSHTGVIITIISSAGLNGYANYQTATMPAFGILLGVFIPALVFVLAKIGGYQYRQGQRWRAGFTALAAGALLILSIGHCATSISLLTFGYSSWYSWIVSGLMAIAVDLGLVACELATIKMK